MEEWMIGTIQLPVRNGEQYYYQTQEYCLTERRTIPTSLMLVILVRYLLFHEACEKMPFHALLCLAISVTEFVRKSSRIFLLEVRQGCWPRSGKVVCVTFIGVRKGLMFVMM